MLEQMVKGIGRLAGLDIRRAQPDIVDFLLSRNVDCVIDVGANTGQFAQQIRRRGYRGKIVSFEPVSSVYEILHAHASSDGAWTAMQFAIGAARGTTSINVSQSSVFSSLLPTSSYGESFHPGMETVHREDVEVVPLDDLFEDIRGDTTFLKIDAQGFEPHVLSGSSRSLQEIIGVQLELPCTPLYDGTWSFGDAVRQMEDCGFRLSQARSVNYSKADRASLLELDCIFRRDEQPSHKVA